MNKIDYGFYEVNLFEGEMNSDWFLKINPKASFEPSLISGRPFCPIETGFNSTGVKSNRQGSVPTMTIDNKAGFHTDALNLFLISLIVSYNKMKTISADKCLLCWSQAQNWTIQRFQAIC